VALITGMEQPLGYAVGNAVEVQEAIDTLRGEGPRDLVDLVTELGGDMLYISGAAQTRKEAKSRIKEALFNQGGLHLFEKLIIAQGGNPAVLENPRLLPQPPEKIEIPSPSDGYVSGLDAREVGMASKVLGAGRQTKDEPIDHSIGIVLKKKTGDSVTAGEPLAVFHSDGDKKKIEAARQKFLAAYSFSPSRIDPPKLIHARVTTEGVETL
jgi:pyrimidine-nucleoside phosphorylase